MLVLNVNNLEMEMEKKKLTFKQNINSILEKKEKARIEKASDKERDILDLSFHEMTVDVQSVMTAPHTNCY